MKWYVAVTTAPRKDPTIQTCLESLIHCGWEPHIFAEPESIITSHPTIQNSIRLGIWRNWTNSVKIALLSKAEVIMTVQDDTLFHPDSKTFVESIMWPAENCGFVSLYTPKHYTIRKDKTLRPRGINKIITRSLWGACALIWPRQVLENIIKDPIIDAWAGAPPKSKNKKVMEVRRNNPHIIANSDTAIGKLMNKHRYSMWFIDPSPVQHIAQYSTIAHGNNSGRRNAFRIADHSIPLDYQVKSCS